MALQFRVAASLAAALVCLGASRAAAQGFTVGGGLQVDAGYEDNPLLRENGGDDVFGTTITPSLALGWSDPTKQAQLNIALPYNTFVGDGVEGGGDDLDSFDQHVNGSFAIRGPRSLLTLHSRYDRNTTRTSELEDTGLLTTNERRQQIAGGFDFAHQLTPTDNVSLTFQARDVWFGSNQLTDYTNYAGAATYNHAFTPRTTLGVSLTGDHFQPDTPSEGTSQAFGLQALAEYRVNPNLTLNFGAGLSYVSRERSRTVGGATVSDRHSGINGIFNAGIVWTPSPLDALEASYSRSLQPSATGVLRIQDVIAINYSRRLAPRWTFDLAALLASHDSAAGSRGGASRQYVSLEPRISWEFREQWALSASYRLRWQDVGGVGDAMANAVFLTLRYRLPRLKL